VSSPVVVVARTALRVAVKPVLRPEVPLRVQRSWLELLSLVAPLPPGVALEVTTAGGRPAERLVPVGAPADAAVLLLHGGGFMTCSPRTHRSFAARLAAAGGVAVTVPHYRRAPEHPYPAPVDDASAAYAELAARGSVAVVGDSAGGTLALLLARRLRDGAGPPPAALGLVSPFVDLTLASSDAYDGEDPYLNASWGRQGATAFVGGADPAALSPLHGDLSGLPPMLVHLSEHERLRPEGIELVERVRASGGSAELVVLPGLWHDVHLQCGLVAEAAQATDELARWVASHLR
jgi:monoterpene epsilon-lactone hydrolase